MIDETKLRILGLRLRKRRLPCYVELPGEPTQKGTRSAKRQSLQAQRLIGEAITAARWKIPPRARIAVTMSFFPERASGPDIHHLVKFYLDLIKGRMFADDRQVVMLTATCSRIARGDSIAVADRTGTTHIRVQRFADYGERYSLYADLTRNTDFRHHSGLREHVRDYSDDDGIQPSAEWVFAMFKQNGMSDADIAKIRAYERQMREERALKINRLEDYDIPGNPDSKYSGITMAGIRDMEYFRIRVGKLPKKGQSPQYESAIRSAAVRMARSIPIRGKITFPIELDIQVTPDIATLEKDLDNIVRDIAPAIKDQILEPSSYIHAYRIYVTPRISGHDKTGSIRVKILPQGEIERFEERIDKTLEAGLEWIKDEISL